MIPRVLSIWGLIAMPLAVLSTILVYFLRMNSFAPVAMAFYIPIALQELALAVWLLVKGVKSSPKEVS